MKKTRFLVALTVALSFATPALVNAKPPVDAQTQSWGSVNDKASSGSVSSPAYMFANKTPAKETGSRDVAPKYGPVMETQTAGLTKFMPTSTANMLAKFRALDSALADRVALVLKGTVPDAGRLEITTFAFNKYRLGITLRVDRTLGKIKSSAIKDRALRLESATFRGPVPSIWDNHERACFGLGCTGTFPSASIGGGTSNSWA